MDLTRTRLVLRERPIVDVLDLALRFVVRHGRAYAKMALLVLPPFMLASEVIARFAGADAVWAFSLFTATFAAAPFTVLASRLVFEEEARVVASVATALRAAPRLFAIRVVVVLGVTIGAALCMLPGVWFVASSLFVVEVAVLERAGVRAAFARSDRIFRRGAGEVLVASFLLAMVEAVVVLAADIGGRAVVSVLLESRAPEPLWSDGWSSLALLGFWLFVPYLATARFFVYLDVRTRSEGWDLQTRFLALASRPSPDERRAA